MNLIIFIILSLMQFIHTVDAMIYAYPRPHSPNSTRNEMFHDKQADFGQNIPAVGLIGRLVLSKPLNACSPVVPPPANPIYSSYFLLVEEAYPGTHCRYVDQAMNAERANYDAVIVYRHDFNPRLVLMGGEGPRIPSLYVKRVAGLRLRDAYLYTTGATIRLEPDPQLPLQLYLIPFAVVVGVCFFFMVIFSVARYARFRLRERRARLTPANLKKIPTKKYNKGDEYDMCAICIEDYEEGDKIRMLPCNHAYHTKCVDPWLTSGKKVCPVCKQSVEIPKQKKKKRKSEDDQQVGTMDGASTSSQAPTTVTTEDELLTDDEDDQEFSETDNERTPLLTAEHDTRDGPQRSSPHTIEV